jgi:tRNA (cytidine/uridine-2'-O-)-methyltransferase
VDVLLVHPEIPHNTGCAARLAAATRVALHLVEPLGFSLEDRYLKRAGLDYWPQVELVVHAHLDGAVRHFGGDERFGQRARLFTARGPGAAGASLFEVDFAADDVLAFGCESAGLPPELLARHPARRVYVPIAAGVRSLNLANVVGLALYTALVRAGVPLPDNDGRYEPHPRASEDVRPGERVRRP